MPQSENSNPPSVVAVAVTYFPELDVLQRLLDALIPQVASVVIVDNGSTQDVAAWVAGQSFGPGVEVLPLGENRGIAVAQNAGIERARRSGAAYVILFDQDSIPMADMVEKLVSTAGELALRGEHVAAVGPRYLDERHNNPPPFIRVRGWRLERCACATPDSVVPVDYLIASGCLIPLAVLDGVGGMREDLFIDYVDIEWGLRARRHGFQSYGACAAHMRHSLGESPIRLFGYNFPLHSPLRHYYHFRNALLLYKEPWVPLYWKLVNGRRMCLKYVFYSLFAKPRMTHWRMMTLGIWHGLTGKSGKLARSSS